MRRRDEEEASGPTTTAGMRHQRLIALALAIAVFTASALIVLFLLDRPEESADALVEGNLSEAQASNASATPAMMAPASPTHTPQPTPSATATAVPPTKTPPPPARQPAAPHVHPSSTPAPPVASDANFAGQVLALVNAERAARGLPPLAALGALTQAAQSYSSTLLQLNTFSHDAGGTSLTSRVQAAGYTQQSLLGEVLWSSQGYLPPERVVADWLASPGHRDILLDGRFTKAGVGCVFREGATVEARCVMVLAG